MADQDPNMTHGASVRTSDQASRCGATLLALWAFFGCAMGASAAQATTPGTVNAPAPASSSSANPGRPSTTISGTLNPTGHRSARNSAQSVGCLIGPMRVADVGSPVTGIVERITVDLGDSVKQGQALVMLRAEVEAAGEKAAHTRWRMDADVQAAAASLELARQRHARASELQSNGFVSPQAVEQAATELRVAEQRLAQSQGQREVLATDLAVVKAQLNQRTVRAPFDGVVIERFRQAGERVEDRPVLRIATLDPLRVDLIVPAGRFGQYQRDDSITVVPELPGVSPVVATVTHVDRVIDAASNTFRVRLSLPNPDNRLPAGARCNLQGDLQAQGATGNAQASAAP